MLKQRSERNKTIQLTEQDRIELLPKIIKNVSSPIFNPTGIIHGDKINSQANFS